jgi:hypothetical protein
MGIVLHLAPGTADNLPARGEEALFTMPVELKGRSSAVKFPAIGFDDQASVPP